MRRRPWSPLAPRPRTTAASASTVSLAPTKKLEYLIVTPPERRADVTVLPRMNRDYLNIFFLQKDLDQLLSCLLPRGQTARITA